MLGIDRDPFAITNFKNSGYDFENHGGRLKILNQKFSNLSRIMITPFLGARGILFDLGYSTAQVSLYIDFIHYLIN